MARIEKQAREKAKLENECEKRELQDKMEIELQELKAQLKLFQKVSGLFLTRRPSCVITNFALVVDSVYTFYSKAIYCSGGGRICFSRMVVVTFV